ncbi:MAG: GDP-mannose 4,6-dehydratase [Candidatus Gribaldobacteria bacterium]|nr:GDP-mannose 4,6-dehydratase [Candidatus Gribaldobacteria bacterium]
MKKYLVTGGAGFVGSNLVRELVKSGEEVLVVDNLSLGRLENLDKVKDKIEFFQINSGGALSQPSIKDLKGIFHLGIPSSSPMYKENHSLLGQAINDFTAILDLAQRENCKLVYASSSSVYNGNEPPLTEDMPILPTDYYTEGRYAMERLAKMYYGLSGVASVGLRFFSVYGPNEKHKGRFANLVSQFFWDMEKDQAPLIYGDGKQTRDFTFVGDIVQALILSMQSQVGCDVFNVGKGESYDMNQLVDILNKALGKNIQPQYQANPIKNYVMYTLADTTKAKRVLGFEAKYSLEQGIQQILKNN